MSDIYDFEGARRAVASLARRTPLLPATELSERYERSVFVKAECLQVTGSFKVRGAAARLSALSESERETGVVACSSGNHGRAVAYVAQKLGVPATVCVPGWVDPVKLDGIRGAGAEALLVGETYDEAEAHALRLADETGRPFVSAYDDPWVIAGQGTLAAEITEDLGRLPGAVIAPLSGGGLVGGIAAAFVSQGAAVRCVGATAENAGVMLASLQAGRPIDLPEKETLANALAGGIGLDNQYSFALIRDAIEEHVTVTEDQIGDAMRYAVRQLHLVLEGGGAVALASVLSGAWDPRSLEPDSPLVVVLSGGNVAPKVLAALLT